MKRFLDSSVLVESCLSASPNYAAADALVNGGHATTSAHALAEAYATLSGDARLRIAPADAAAVTQKHNLIVNTSLHFTRHHIKQINRHIRQVFVFQKFLS